MSLREPRLKMSKSAPDGESRILINDTRADIQRKISSALTDSEPNITYDAQNRSGISNLLTLLSCFDARQRLPTVLAEEYHSLSKRDFKNLVVEAIDGGLAPIREKYNYYVCDRSLREFTLQGTIRAQERAAMTMKQVRDLVQLT